MREYLLGVTEDKPATPQAPLPAMIEEILSPRRLQAFLARNKLAARHGLGQNFLVNRPTLERIARAGELVPGERVAEVGPGLGFLTAFLLAAGCRVTSFEKDRALIPFLTGAFGDNGNFTLVEGDVLKSDPAAVLGDEPCKLVANLPYNITSPVFGLFLPLPNLSRMVVTVQRQVAERIVAREGNKTYGAFTLFCQFWAKAELLFHIAPGNFHPAPSVYSSVVRLTRREPPLSGAAREMFFALVRAVFTSRRKTLRNNLRNCALPGIDAAAAVAVLEAAGIDPESRGEKLPLEGFCALAAKLAEAAG